MSLGAEVYGVEGDRVFGFRFRGLCRCLVFRTLGFGFRGFVVKGSSLGLVQVPESRQRLCFVMPTLRSSWQRPSHPTDDVPMLGESGRN